MIHSLFITPILASYNKNYKIAAVPTHVPLEALYLVIGGLIVPPKENVCTAAILDFLSSDRH